MPGPWVVWTRRKIPSRSSRATAGSDAARVLPCPKINPRRIAPDGGYRGSSQGFAGGTATTSRPCRLPNRLEPAGPIRLRLRLVHLERTTVHLVAVQALDAAGGIGLRHLDEAEATRLTGVTIGDQGDRLDRPVLRKQRPDSRFIGGERQVAYVNLSHCKVLTDDGLATDPCWMQTPYGRKRTGGLAACAGPIHGSRKSECDATPAAWIRNSSTQRGPEADVAPLSAPTVRDRQGEGSLPVGSIHFSGHGRVRRNDDAYGTSPHNRDLRFHRQALRARALERRLPGARHRTLCRRARRRPHHACEACRCDCARVRRGRSA